MTLIDFLDKEQMTVAEFADLVGSTRQSVYNWLDGVKPQMSSMRRIIRATDGKVTRKDFDSQWFLT